MNKVGDVFQIIAWDETPYCKNEDGSKQSHAKISQTYRGTIEGTSELQYLMSYQSSSSAVFVGMETIQGSIKGKPGSFILRHNGIFENGVACSDFTIISNSGKGELAGIEGSGSFRSGENGQAHYELTSNV